jgi:beta-N-acetylhexosaminidase
MSLRQKIGQRFMVFLSGTSVDEQMVKLIHEGGVAGFIVYRWNAKTRDQTQRLIAGLQAAASRSPTALPLFIAADQEGGRVAAFRFPEIVRPPAAHYWGKHGDPAYSEALGYLVGKELMSLGCNMNFAPVLDLYAIADGTIIGDRAISNDPALVAQLGTAYVRGALRSGVIPVIKHFPGHGSTTVDSHGNMPVVRLPAPELEAKDFLPFHRAIQAGAPAVMTAHVLYPAFDPEFPATLSSVILDDVLRRDMGFRGVVISDGFAMGAISKNFDVRESLRLSFQAGVDIILVHDQYNVFDLIDMVVELHENGEVPAGDIDAGLRRVLALKRDVGLLPGEPKSSSMAGR